MPSQMIAFVTSFQPDMYRATGCHLLASFLGHCTEMQLIACTEQFGTQRLEQQGECIEQIDITNSDLLLGWLRTHRDIIPTHLGGDAKPCQCNVVGFGIDEVHQRGCPYGWYNRNASRWFRKIIAMDEAAKRHPSARLIWIDSDCRFKRAVTQEIAGLWFGAADGFYLKSPQRRVLESGVFGLDLPRKGQQFLDALIERYTSGAFRSDGRWDDGYQIQAVIDSRRDIRMADLAPLAYPYHAEVLAASPVGKYLDHFRGTHGPVLQLMT